MNWFQPQNGTFSPLNAWSSSVFKISFPRECSQDCLWSARYLLYLLLYPRSFRILIQHGQLKIYPCRKHSYPTQRSHLRIKPCLCSNRLNQTYILTFFPKKAHPLSLQAISDRTNSISSRPMPDPSPTFSSVTLPIVRRQNFFFLLPLPN